MSLLRMSLSGAAVILVITVIRAIAVYRLPKRLLLAFWWVAVARLILPISFPPLGRLFTPAGQPTLTAEVEKTVSVLERGAARILPAGTPAIPALKIIWIMGAALCFGHFAARYLRCRREFETSLPVNNDFVQKWLSGHPLRRAVEVRTLPGISTPLTYGLIHPVILMPKGTDWGNERQLQYVLFHEYVHIRRFDGVGKLIVALTACIHWFDPMVWVLYILFNRDIELACDECVLRRFGGDDRASYARALISMEETRRNFPFYSCFAKNSIEERIESIMRFRKKSAGALVLALVLVTVAAGTAFAASDAGEMTVSNPDGVVRAGEPSTRTEYTKRPEAGVIHVEERPALSENTVFDIEGSVTDVADTSDIRGDIAPNTGYTFKALPIAAGQRLTVSVSGACPGAKLQIGYAGENGEATYVDIAGEGGAYSFTVSETGTYKLFLFNSSEYNVSGINLSYNLTAGS